MARAPHLTSIKGYAPDFVARVLDRARASPGAPPVFGIAGLQGSGKSTLARQLVAAGRSCGCEVVALSLDDFYRTRRERQALARDVHPLLATRGPPAAPAVALAGRTLSALCRLGDGETLALPAFDKAGDRRLPPSRWPQVTRRPDLVVFEGWFLGVPPEADAALATPINALERDEDPDGRWRRHCNEALAEYATLWCRINRLLFLQPPRFEVVPGWRGQPEQDLASRGHGAMSAAELARFVLFFERVSRQALATLPRLADHVVPLDDERRPRD